LLTADQAPPESREIVLNGAHDRPAVSLQRANRQGVTLRLHAGHGLSDDELLAKVKLLLETLAADGGGLKR
jgi:ParB family chromosome partitioning protein